MDIFKELNINLPNLEFKENERYLPTAFDDSLTQLQKVNKVIEYLNQYKLLTEKMLLKWNEVYRWVMGEGLDNAVGDRLQEWLKNGIIADIINNELFNKLNLGIETNKEEINLLRLEFNGLNDEFNNLNEDYNKLSNELESLSDDIKDFIGMIEGEIDSILDEIKLIETITYNIGDSGDFKSINEAITNVSMKLNRYDNKKIKLILMDNYVFNEQLLVYNVDLSFIEIYSESVVEVKPDNFNSIELNENNLSVTPTIYGENSKLPKIDVLLKCVSGSRDNYVGCLLNNSSVVIGESKGFNNFNYYGLLAVNLSKVIANNSNFNDNGVINSVTPSNGRGAGIQLFSSELFGKGCTANNCSIGFSLSNTSKAEINYSIAKNCGHHALLVASSSMCTAKFGVFTDTLDDNVVAYISSFIDMSGSDCSRSGSAENSSSGIYCIRNSSIYAHNVTINDVKKRAISCGMSSYISAMGMTIDGVGSDGIVVETGSIINFMNGKISNVSIDGAKVQDGSTLVVKNAIFDTFGDDGIQVVYGGRVSGENLTIKNANNNGIYVDSGYFSGKNSQISNCNFGVNAVFGSVVSIGSSKIENSIDKGVYSSASQIYMNQSTVSNSGGRGVEFSRGSYGNIFGVEFTNNNGDIFLFYGSIVTAHNTNGESNIDGNELLSNGILLR